MHELSKRDLSQLRGRVVDTDAEPAWRPFEIDSVWIDGVVCPVAEHRQFPTPFTVLTTMRPVGRQIRAHILIVMAMSGHSGFVLRDLVAGLLAEHTVSVLDWINARYVPLSVGAFGFVDNIGAVVDALVRTGPGTQLVGICQGAVPAAVAASALCQRTHPCRPASLILLGGPIDPQANMTRISTMLAMTPVRWLEAHSLAQVPAGLPGAGRWVYPAAAQQQGLLTYLSRHMLHGTSFARTVLDNEGLDADRFPFLDLFTSVKDIPGEAFVESIAAIYHDRALWRGALAFDGQAIRPQQVRDLPVLTIEAPEDDITAPGQTSAARMLFCAVPAAAHKNLLLSEGNHFSLFHGPVCRHAVVPAIADFIAARSAALQ